MNDNDNNNNDTDTNYALHNVYVSSGIGLLNRHTPTQDNESNNLNEMNMSVDIGDDNGDYCYVNSSTGSEIKIFTITLIIQRKEMKFLPTDI